MPAPPTPTTFSTGEVLTATKLNQISQVVTWITTGKPDLRVHATTTQSVSSGTWTSITTFDTLDADTEGGWSAIGQSYTVAVTGIYVIQASVTYASSGTFNFSQRVRLLKNGSALYLGGSSIGHTGYSTDSAVTSLGTFPLTAGDAITVQGWQGSGSSLNTATNFASGANEASFLDIACIRTGAP